MKRATATGRALRGRKVPFFRRALIAAGQEAAEVVELGDASETPRVSVVVPTYNHRPFVLELLESLRSQSDVAFEVVVVDDGSSDGSFAAIIERARALELTGRVIGLRRNCGRSTARNAGILQARASIIAFVDADCQPVSGWLVAALAAFEHGGRIGAVQGPTLPHPTQRRPLFSHFIEIAHYDGSFSTCNVFYRREALLEVGGFDPSVIYWEDVDIGWRVCRAGWEGTFAPAALVYHQVVLLTARQWLLWPLHFGYMPAKTARYPEYRRFLFLGIWVHWFHALFDLLLLGVILGRRVHPLFILLTLPYLVAFPRRHGLRGRCPPLKVAANVAWDAMSFGVLLTSSYRHRSLVL